MVEKRRIALVGTAPSAVHAPFDDRSWEIWGVGMRADYVTRADRWFELHRLDGEPPHWAAGWRSAVKLWSGDLNCEVWMFYPEPLGSKIVTFPHERISKRFGTFFLTSTFAWQMALAIDEKVDEIGLWGVDMEYGTEYRSQRAGLRHFMDLARFAGIAVTRLASGGVAYEPIPYPLTQDDPLLSKLAMRDKITRDEIAGCEKKRSLTRNMIAQNKAVVAEIGLFQQEGYRSKERLVALEKESVALMADLDKEDRDIAVAQGANEEQRWLKDYLVP